MNKIDVCNYALSKLNVEDIDTFNDGSKASRLCKMLYDKERRKLLRSTAWNFAVKRVVLAPDVATPTFGFSQQFSLPYDFIRVIELNDDTKDFVVESGKLLCSATSVKLIYVGDETDVGMFDSLFVELLALTMAAELAYALLQSMSLKQEILQEVQVILRDARSTDSMEQTQKANIPLNDWIEGRQGTQDFGRIKVD